MGLKHNPDHPEGEIQEVNATERRHTTRARSKLGTQVEVGELQGVAARHQHVGRCRQRGVGKGKKEKGKRLTFDVEVGDEHAVKIVDALPSAVRPNEGDLCDLHEEPDEHFLERPMALQERRQR